MKKIKIKISPHGRSSVRRKNESGIAVILSILILSVIITIALSTSTAILKELEFGKDAGFYAIAFFAADSGIEKILTVRDAPIIACTTPATACILSNFSKYWVVVTPSGGVKPDGSTCASSNFCVESTGEFELTRRAIEVDY